MNGQGLKRKVGRGEKKIKPTMSLETEGKRRRTRNEKGFYENN